MQQNTWFTPSVPPIGCVTISKSLHLPHLERGSFWTRSVVFNHGWVSPKEILFGKMWGIFHDHSNCGDTMDIWQAGDRDAKCLQCLGWSHATKIRLTQIASWDTALNILLISYFFSDSAVIYLFLFIFCFFTLWNLLASFWCLDGAYISFGPKDSMNHPREIAKNSDSWSHLKTTDSTPRSPGEVCEVSNLLYLLVHLTRP